MLPHLEVLSDPRRHEAHGAALAALLNEVEHQSMVAQCVAHVMGLLIALPAARGCCRETIDAGCSRVRRACLFGGAGAPPNDPFQLGPLTPPYRSDLDDEIFWEEDDPTEAEFHRWKAAALAVLGA